MEYFSSREIASAIWLVVIFFFIVAKDDRAKSLIGVLKALFQVKLLFVMEALAIYVMVSVYVLTFVLEYNLDTLKAAILWYFFVGLPLAFKAVSATDDYNPFQTWIATTFTFVIIIEFLVSKYTLPLFAEIVFLPVIAFIAMMSVVAERNEEHAAVYRLCNWALAIIGGWLIFSAASNFISGFQAEFGLGLVQEFSLPILLSFLTIPFFYLLHGFVTYENALITSKLWCDDEKQRRKMLFSAFFSFGLNYSAVRRWCRIVRIEKPTDSASLEQTIAEAKRADKLSKKPPAVESTKGWSPYIAKTFLENLGIKTLDYRQEYHGKWYTESSGHKIPQGDWLSFIVFYIEGTETVASSLRLKLTLNDLDKRDAGLTELRRLETALLRKAVGKNAVERFEESFSSYNDQIIDLATHQISLSKDVIRAGKIVIEEYEFDLKITHAE